MSRPTVAILGASTNREKYGNKAVRAYLNQGYRVFPVTPNADEVEGQKAYPALGDIPADSLDRVTVYLPPKVGITLLDDIRRCGAREVWLNPGSESPELIQRAKELGLNVITACSILDLGISPVSP